MELAPREKILILEDDRGIATLEARKIKSMGFDPVIATSSTYAYDMLEKDQFHAILLDHNIGEKITGIDFYNSITAKGDFTPAILVTGLESPEVLMNAIRAGIRDFVPKHENFLEDLHDAIIRAVSQSRLEKDAAIAHDLKEKNDILESVITAANLCYTKSTVNSNRLYFWEGKLKSVFGSDDIAEIKTRSQLMASMVEEDVRDFEIDLNRAEKDCANVSSFIRFKFDPKRWIFVQGRCFPSYYKTPQSIIFVFSDVSRQKTMEIDLIQSNMRITALNKRLQIGSVEAHHRIKNSFQNITSLLNLQIRKSGGLDLEETQKLSSHIQGLSKLHDLLTEKMVYDEDGSKIDISLVIGEITNTIRHAIPFRELVAHLDEILLPSKIACTISVIVNELLSNAIKHGNGVIELTLTKERDMATLSVINECSKFPENMTDSISGRNGLSIVEALSKGDLGVSPSYLNTSSGKAKASVTFSIENVK